MRKKTLLWVIVLMTISLIGLIGFQVYWIHHAVQMEEEVFDRNVNDALHQVVRQLETQEAVHFLKEEAPQIREAAFSEDVPILAEAKRVEPSKNRRNQERRRESCDNDLFEAVTGKTFKATKVAPPAPSRVTVSASARSLSPVKVLVPQAEVLMSAKVQEVHGTTYVRGVRSMAATKGNTEIFGKGPTDSVIIWRILASQKHSADSLFRKNTAQTFQKIKSDSTFVVRMSYDSLTRAKQQQLLKLSAKNIKSINVHGNVVDIYTDTLLGTREWQHAISRGVDSVARTMGRYFPAAKATPHSATVVYGPGKSVRLTSPTPAPQQAKKVKTSPVAPKDDPEKNKHQKAEAKAQHLNKVMQQMAVEYVRKEKPLAQRLQELNLDELLTAELETRNISIPYNCTLQTASGSGNANMILASTGSPLLPAYARENQYAVRLFPNDVMTAPGFLLLNFPDRNLYVWHSLLIPSAISVLFTLIIILTFSFTLYTILRQKKISEIKNDFINNMTHEFKTPIATISLALDALVNPKVRKDEARVDYYARIIKDENKRMHQQVEKVLQTAQMERQSLQLAFEEVDVHQLIRQAAEPFQLHIEQKQGVLDLKLDARSPYVWADPGHLANMIGNLLDNANKYSPTAPHIVIQTTTISNGIHISVEDQGVGMSREAQKKVFEKFYRVPTGNVHNVKGFGLGLSYVKTMAEAHCGSIHLRSELGKGSKFTLWLPFHKNAC